jgi:hypothetical protein
MTATRMIILVTKTYIRGWMENLPQKRPQVSIFSLVRNAVPAFSWKKEQKKKNTFFNVACPAKESNLTRRPNGKYKNLMEIISDLNVLIAAYNK